MTPVTQQNLLDYGYTRLLLREGVVEYWKPFYPNRGPQEQLENRIGVRFGENKHEVYIVYLTHKSGWVRLYRETMEQIERLYNLLREPE